MEQVLSCSRCKQLLQPTCYFCPNCGKKLWERPLTMLDEIGLYLVSFFIPPLGLLRGYTLLKQQGNRFKRAGVIAIVLTMISLFLVIRWTIELTNSVTALMYGQGGNLQNLGF